MVRPITLEELKTMNLSTEQIDEILATQNKKKERRYRYIVALTALEAEQLSKKTGKEFVRATEWKGQKREHNLTT